MSEVQGTLLSIVLAVSVFAIVFGIIMLSINKSSNTVALKIDDAAKTEVEVTPDESLTASYVLTY